MQVSQKPEELIRFTARLTIDKTTKTTISILIYENSFEVTFRLGTMHHHKPKRAAAASAASTKPKLLHTKHKPAPNSIEGIHKRARCVFARRCLANRVGRIAQVDDIPHPLTQDKVLLWLTA